MQLGFSHSRNDTSLEAATAITGCTDPNAIALSAHQLSFFK
ncbi:hypothetical protein DESC_240033 [Desulfosarcina cetonica]|nr:hypothetical protein DESC_240033 [Desulfosarcina cetonica]